MNYLDWKVLLCLSQKLRNYKVLQVIIPVIFPIFSESCLNILKLLDKASLVARASLSHPPDDPNWHLIFYYC